jgi:hypothetical protein
VIFGSAHLKDERLFDCYFRHRMGEPAEPRSANHLAGCADCTDRLRELAAFLDGVRDEADLQVNAAFPASRLMEQRQQIRRRLEHLHRSARVISFPARNLETGPRGAGTLTARWVAGAAAAGLFIGFAVGGYLGPERLHRAKSPTLATNTPPMSVQRTAPAPAVLAGSAAPEPADDDAFLLELELALERPHAQELQPFDALTPHVSDIETRVR